jgi:glycosyltransferase involved in cell wall biosynthesis
MTTTRPVLELPRTASSFKRLTGLSRSSGAPVERKLKVVIASFDFRGPVRNGGVGTAFTSLAEALAAAGHEVTCLYLCGEWCENKKLEDWIAAYKSIGIDFVPLPSPKELRLAGTWHQNRAYEAYLWLKERQFDVVHFAEWKGGGYFCLTAKRQGLAFQNTTLCVHAHGPTLWHKLNNGDYINSVEDLEVLYLERRSAEMADVLVSPSQYLLRWMTEAGWRLTAEHCFVQPYVQPRTPGISALLNRNESDGVSPRSNGELAPVAAKESQGAINVNELVFFGRLEIRKGLALFCDALNLLKQTKDCPRFKVTFLGKSTDVLGTTSEKFIQERSAAWPWAVQLLTDFDQNGAFRYLKEGGRLAIIPSLADNLPNTVLECLGGGIPFVASFAGGIPEMINEEDWAKTCFSLKPQALANVLLRCLREGVEIARPAIAPAENERGWLAWHASLLKIPADASQHSGHRTEHVNGSRPQALPSVPGNSTAQVKRTNSGLPLVTVCVTHRDRPHYLRHAIASLKAQTYPHLEVLVMDDASVQPETLAYLDELETDLAERSWKLTRLTENRFPGAARNAAAHAARGEYLLFMDDDNVAKPNEISVMVNVARHTGADVISCAADIFEGLEEPKPTAQPMVRWVFKGASASVGLFDNCFGDTNALIRRQVFLELGGFHENWGVNHEDWELLAKAVLSGYRLEAIPEALVWYRMNPNEATVGRSTPAFLNRLQVLRPYLKAMPPEISDLVLYTQGLAAITPDLTIKVNQLTEVVNLYGLLARQRINPPRGFKRFVFRVLGGKMRRSLRKRMIGLIQWLLEPADTYAK